MAKKNLPAFSPAADNPSAYSFSIAACVPVADGVTVNYIGIPSNLPQSYNNFVALWKNPDFIPWQVAPLKEVPIDHDDTEGSIEIEIPLTGTAYIIGYGVGKGIGTICCTAKIDRTLGLLVAPPSSVSITLKSNTLNTVTVQYNTLQGYKPQQYGNWVGLWQGFASPYDNPGDPVSSSPVKGNASQGILVLNDVSLLPDTAYTLIYFMGAELTMAAAIVYFNST